MTGRGPGSVGIIRSGVVAAALVFAAVSVIGTSPAGAHTPHDEISSVAVSPDFARDDTVFTISRRYLLKSTDGGDTWVRLVQGLDGQGQPSSVQVAAQDPDVVYLSTRGSGVYRSDDGGDSWRAVNGNMGQKFLSFVEVSPNDPNVAVVAGARPGSGGWLTQDGGVTWSELSDFESISAMGFAPDDPNTLVVAEKAGGVHVSDDLGASWRSTELEMDGINEIQTVLVDARYRESQRVFVGTKLDGVWASQDGGETFAAVPEGPSDPKIIDLIQSGIDGDQPTLWASTADEGVFLSDDDGQSWMSEVEGLTTDEQADRIGRANFGQLSAASSDGSEDPTMFMASFDGLFRSESRADGWVNLATQVSTNVVGIAVSPDYVNDSTVAVATYINGALLSEDGGDSFETINDGFVAEFDWKRREDYVVRLMGIQMYPTFPDDQMMQVGVRGYYLESSDAGGEWSARLPEGIIVPDEFPPDYYLPVFSPDFETDRSIFLGTDGGKVFRYSGDADAIELVADIGEEITAMAISPGFARDETVFAGTVNGVAVSADGGVSWSKVGFGGSPVTSLAVSQDFETDETAFAGTPWGLRVTRDSGVTWEPLSAPALGVRPVIESVVISPPTDDGATMLVSVRGRGLFRSTDGGESFVPIAPDLIENQVVFSSFYHPTSEPIVFSPTFAQDQTIFGMAEDHVYRSTDGGESFETIDVPVSLHDVDEDPESGFLPSTRYEISRVSGDVTPPDGAGFDTPIGKLSPKRVGAALVAGLAVFGLLSVPLRRRHGDETAGADEPDEPDEPVEATKDDQRTRMAVVPNLLARAAIGCGAVLVALLLLAA